MLKEYDFSIRGTKGRVALLGFLTILILFGTHTKLFSFVAFVISSLIVVYDKTNFRLMLITYLMLMAHIFKISSSGMSYFTFLVFLYIGSKLIEEKTILWTVMLFIIYVMTVQFIRMNVNVTNDIKLFGNILFIGYALGEIRYFTDEDKNELCITYILSVIISSIMRFFDSSFFRISSFTAPLNTEGYGAGYDRIVRFSGLYQDPNYYSVNLILSLCLLAVLFYKGKTSVLFCGLSAVVLLYFGTLTYSKSFLLMLLLPLVMFMYACQKIGRVDVQVTALVLIAAGIALVLVSNPDYIASMLRRVEKGSSLTTGRSDMWQLYLYYIYDNPDVLLFGRGIGAELLAEHAPHNVYIDILYYLGTIGGFLLITAIVNSGARYGIKRKVNLLNFSALLCVLITYFFLSQLHDYEFPVHFMFAFMVLNQWDLSTTHEYEEQVVCSPLLPDFNSGKVKTLLTEIHE